MPWEPTTKGIFRVVGVFLVVGIVGLVGSQFLQFPKTVYWPLMLVGFGVALAAFIFWIVILENA